MYLGDILQITSDTKRKRAAMSSQLRQALERGVDVSTDRSFVVRYFDKHEHHYLGPVCLMQMTTTVLFAQRSSFEYFKQSIGL